MSSRLHIRNAIKVAENSYFEDGLKVDFMAVAALNDALVYAYSQDAAQVDGVRLDDLADALITLAVRNQHSRDFANLIEQGRDLAEHLVAQDVRLLGDLKYWHILSKKERLESCQYFADAVRDIFLGNVGLPPDRKVLVRETFSVDDHCRFYPGDESGLIMRPFTVRARKSERVSGTEMIFINSYAGSDFHDPYLTYAGIFGAYIALIQQNLNGIVRSKFQDTLYRLDHDRALWDNASKEKAFIDPMLHDIHPIQFSTALIDAQEVRLEAALQEIVEEKADEVPERAKITLKDKITYSVGRFLGQPGL